jgi:hypothetical protein
MIGYTSPLPAGNRKIKRNDNIDVLPKQGRALICPACLISIPGFYATITIVVLSAMKNNISIRLKPCDIRIISP